MDVLADVRAQRGHLYDDGGQRSCTTAAYGVLYVGEHGKYDTRDARMRQKLSSILQTSDRPVLSLNPFLG